MESEQHHLRVCMLLSILPQPTDVMRIRASLRDNLALYSVQDLIGIVKDLALGNTYLGDEVQENRPVVSGRLIPDLVWVTQISSCPQCLYPQPSCLCGGRTLPASFTTAVTTPPVYTTPVTLVQPLLQGAAYGVGSAPDSYPTGQGPQPTLTTTPVSVPPREQAPAEPSPTLMETSLPTPDPAFWRLAPPQGSKHFVPQVPQSPAPIRQAPLPRPTTPYIQAVKTPKVSFSAVVQHAPQTIKDLPGGGRGILKLLGNAPALRVGCLETSGAAEEVANWHNLRVRLLTKKVLEGRVTVTTQ